MPQQKISTLIHCASSAWACLSRTVELGGFRSLHSLSQVIALSFSVNFVFPRGVRTSGCLLDAFLREGILQDSLLAVFLPTLCEMLHFSDLKRLISPHHIHERIVHPRCFRPVFFSQDVKWTVMNEPQVMGDELLTAYRSHCASLDDSIVGAPFAYSSYTASTAEWQHIGES